MAFLEKTLTSPNVGANLIALNAFLTFLSGKLSGGDYQTARNMLEAAFLWAPAPSGNQ